MNYPLTLAWLLGSAALAVTHWFAIEASLYWYYWWFDILMHFWGGLLLGFGFHLLAGFSYVRLQLRFWQLFLALSVVIIGWEVFEYLIGLYDPATYVFEVSKDLLVGYGGGLLAHIIMNSRYNNAI